MFPPLEAALQTLATWLALAPISAGGLLVAALALLAWGAWQRRRSPDGKRALLGAAEAVALLVETRYVRASAQAVYESLTADPFAGLPHSFPPGFLALYERRLLALVQTAQLQVEVVVCVGAAFLLGVVIVGVRLWWRAQGPALARIWRGWSRGWRTVAALALLLACAGSAGGAFAAYQARQPKPFAACSSAITAADDA